MSKKLILPRKYAETIKERLKGKYSLSLIQKVRNESRENLQIHKELLRLSEEYKAEIKQLKEREAAIINS